MRGGYFFRIVFGLILIGVLITLGVYLYNAGVAQGLASGTGLRAPEGSAPPLAYGYPPFYRPLGFCLFGLIVPLFFLFLVFGLLRGLFFHGWQRSGPGLGRWKWGGSPEHWKEGVPPAVAEWHRKLHAEEPESDQE